MEHNDERTFAAAVTFHMSERLEMRDRETCRYTTSREKKQLHARSETGDRCPQAGGSSLNDECLFNSGQRG
jgi:hypothetical protein